MCTSIAFRTKDFYFGRNLDLECGFGEEVALTPRGYRFQFRRMPERLAQYAMIGMATVQEGYPLYAEAANEKGLCMAGLNFPGNAYYPKEEREGLDPVSPFELIPWILCQCATSDEAEALFRRMQLVDIPFREDLPLSPLHWHIADRNRSFVVEAVKTGLHIYDNPVGVLTNNPSFDFQQMNLNQYLNLTNRSPEDRFSKQGLLSPFGQGMGAIGLPGDFSPASRFVKAAFLLENSSRPEKEEKSVSQFFHLLEGVAMVEGSVLTPEGAYDKTRYSCCINADQGIYYYKTYDNSRITAVKMKAENLSGDTVISFPLRTAEDVLYENGC